MSQKTNEYKAEAIEILEGLDAVRMRLLFYAPPFTQAFGFDISQSLCL